MKGALTSYAVNNLYPAIQGEGVQTGIPMLLLRLQGCDVGCPFCDTKETWHLDQSNRRQNLNEVLGTNEFFVVMTGDQILDAVQSIAGSIRWIMITGGEPARFDLNPLLNPLHKTGFHTAIETSGTCPLKSRPKWICVSPKYDMPGNRSLIADVISRADELKFVVGKSSDLEIVDSILNQYHTRKTVQICLQPISLSRTATEICVETVLKRGWRLSLQMHKLIDIE